MAVTVRRRKQVWGEDREIEVQGQPVRIQAKRLTLDELGEFKLDFLEFMQQGRRGVPVRQAGEDALTDDQVWERRLLLDESERSADRERLRQRRARIIEFWRHTVTEYVQVAAGDLQDEQGEAILTGAALWQTLHDDETVIAQCVLTVFLENTLSEDAKKKLPSWRDLLRSLHAPTNGANGDALAPTVASAASSDSVASEGVTAVTVDDPSGSMVH